MKIRLYGGSADGEVVEIDWRTYQLRAPFHALVPLTERPRSLLEYREVVYQARLYDLPGGRRIWRWTWEEDDGRVGELDPIEKGRAFLPANTAKPCTTRTSI